jgi:hypothetical protein
MRENEKKHGGEAPWTSPMLRARWQSEERRHAASWEKTAIALMHRQHPNSPLVPYSILGF